MSDCSDDCPPHRSMASLDVVDIGCAPHLRAVYALNRCNKCFKCSTIEHIWGDRPINVKTKAKLSLSPDSERLISIGLRAEMFLLTLLPICITRVVAIDLKEYTICMTRNVLTSADNWWQVTNSCPVLVGTTTKTTETLYGSFPCNGHLLKEVIRDDVFHTSTPCTGITFFIGNDSYDLTLAEGRTDTLDLVGPQTYSAYLNGRSMSDKHIDWHLLFLGYQLFTQFGVIDRGVCKGGLFITVQLLYPENYKSCVTEVGLERAQSYYTYMKIHGGKCHADCQGFITIDFQPPLQGYPMKLWQLFCYSIRFQMNLFFSFLTNNTII